MISYKLASEVSKDRNISNQNGNNIYKQWLDSLSEEDLNMLLTDYNRIAVIKCRLYLGNRNIYVEREIRLIESRKPKQLYFAIDLKNDYTGKEELDLLEITDEDLTNIKNADDTSSMLVKLTSESEFLIEGRNLSKIHMLLATHEMLSQVNVH